MELDACSGRSLIQISQWIKWLRMSLTDAHDVAMMRVSDSSIPMDWNVFNGSCCFDLSDNEYASRYTT